jgi:hypothetical protein
MRKHGCGTSNAASSQPCNWQVNEPANEQPQAKVVSREDRRPAADFCDTGRAK